MLSILDTTRGPGVLPLERVDRLTESSPRPSQNPSRWLADKLRNIICTLYVPIHHIPTKEKYSDQIFIANAYAEFERFIPAKAADSLPFHHFRGYFRSYTWQRVHIAEDTFVNNFCTFYSDYYKR